MGYRSGEDSLIYTWINFRSTSASTCFFSKYELKWLTRTGTPTSDPILASILVRLALPALCPCFLLDQLTNLTLRPTIPPVVGRTSEKPKIEPIHL